MTRLKKNTLRYSTLSSLFLLISVLLPSSLCPCPCPCPLCLSVSASLPLCLCLCLCLSLWLLSYSLSPLLSGLHLRFTNNKTANKTSGTNAVCTRRWSHSGLPTIANVSLAKVEPSPPSSLLPPPSLPSPACSRQSVGQPVVSILK